MKSFKDYLTESKKVYEFKVKVADDCGKGANQKIRAALAPFQVCSCSPGKSTPIQENSVDFPEHKNISTTIFDVATQYPATSLQIQALIAEALNLTQACVKVRNLKEAEEEEINHANDTKSGKALLGSEYEASGDQSNVGDKHVMSLLKELGKHSTTGTQYKGVNDELLASAAPTFKQGK